MNIEIIVARSVVDNAIGKNNKLLWNIPEDLANFKKITYGHHVVMGRKTWESLPEKFRPLPGRQNIVISRDIDYKAPGAEVMSVFDVANFAHDNPQKKIFIIGGGEIYKRFIPLASRMHITNVYKGFDDADSFFPEFDISEWKIVLTTIPITQNSGVLYSFNEYERYC